jgi:hypothetical protein
MEFRRAVGQTDKSSSGLKSHDMPLDIRFVLIDKKK